MIFFFFIFIIFPNFFVIFINLFANNLLNRTSLNINIIEFN
nr:MAG TPA: hypothetical protein [Caudoviricetes sp.]